MTETIEKSNGKYDIVIVGSGFSGIAAAGILAGHRLSVLLVDENIHVGGQLLRKIPDQLGDYSSYHPDYVKKLGFRFVYSTGISRVIRVSKPFEKLNQIPVIKKTEIIAAMLILNFSFC